AQQNRLDLRNPHDDFPCPKQAAYEGKPPCHQCSKGLEWRIRSIVSLPTRGSAVPSTSRLTPRRPAIDSSTLEKGKSVPQKILSRSVMRYSCAAIRMFQNCQGR